MQASLVSSFLSLTGHIQVRGEEGKANRTARSNQRKDIQEKNKTMHHQCVTTENTH